MNALLLVPICFSGMPLPANLLNQLHKPQMCPQHLALPNQHHKLISLDLGHYGLYSDNLIITHICNKLLSLVPQKPDSFRHQNSNCGKQFWLLCFLKTDHTVAVSEQKQNKAKNKSEDQILSQNILRTVLLFLLTAWNSQGEQFGDKSWKKGHLMLVLFLFLL